nr:hypothetical protein [Dehalogenimonas alkenigignens]
MLDLDVLRKSYDALWGNGLPFYVSFSGKKGYHLTAFFESAVPTQQAIETAQRVKKLLGAYQIPYDSISPSITGKGNSFALPLGLHPETGKLCHFLDDDLNEVSDPIDFLKNISRITVSQSSLTTPDTISARPCVNQLWKAGLQKPHTRHSATCVIANALVKNKELSEKESLIIHWAGNRIPDCLTTSSREWRVKDALRLLKHYQRYGAHAELCENPIFKSAMRSACEKEFQCKLVQNHGHCNLRLLQRLGVFNAPNAKPKGIGKSAWAIYLVIEDIADELPVGTWDKQPTFTLSIQQLIQLSNCSKRTVIDARNKLLDYGLLKRVPVASRFTLYVLPAITQDLVGSVLSKLRE